MENILKENIRSSTENQGNNGVSTQKNFRFFDNRQKYLLFVSTCSEKEIISKHVGKEISLLNPSPPAIRVFDAGMGDGTLLASVLRNLHQRFPTLPFYISGKEISLEDVRLCLSKMGDRLYEHPATVLVFTNLFYNEASWLRPKKSSAANSLVWKELPLDGNTSHDFSEQLNGLGGFLQKTGRHVTVKEQVIRFMITQPCWLFIARITDFFSVKSYHVKKLHLQTLIWLLLHNHTGLEYLLNTKWKRFYCP